MNFCCCCNIYCLLKTNRVWIGRYSTRPIDTSSKKFGENISCLLLLLRCPMYAYLLSTTLPSSLPVVTHNRGATWQSLLFLPHYRACLRAIREKLHVCHMFRIFLKFPSPASTWVELVSMQPTKHSIIRGALSAVNLYTDVFVSGFDMDRYEHTRHTCWHSATADTVLRVVHIFVKYRVDIMRYIAWYPYRDNPKIFSTLISIHLENIAWYIFREV